jgi:membrane protease YdiL (CAAX protease family)
LAVTRKMNTTLRTWAVLTEASAAASTAVLPYVLGLLKDIIARDNTQRIATGKRPISLARLAILSAAQGHVLFGSVAALGLRAARSMGLGAPHLEARLRGQPSGLRPSQVAAYAAGGVGAALVAGAFEFTAFARVHAQLQKAGVREPGLWRVLLAIPYGAIAEEVLMRLGGQSLIAAGLRRLRRETAIPPSSGTMWPAIALSTLLFGAGHLPITSQLTRLTPMIIARSLVLNAAPGVVCGYLYWQQGLEAAMIAHGSADVVLHVGGTLIQNNRVTAQKGGSAPS